MNSRIILALILTLGLFPANGSIGQKAFERGAFYAAMASSKLDEVDQQLSALKSYSGPEKEAYEGALLMKKSGLMNKAKEKLNLFKSGRSKLEASIARDKNNAEYRFLRLIIQEHAPKLVNYRNEIDNDTRQIRSNYRSLPDAVQLAILDYAKKSTVLKASFFN
ncbi:MAG: hypothetical protein IPI66_02710 [Chitinophagaceae bacterium]|nr:hypothetical protein [Chitinophagaceae bacterium]MBL0055093.1 hypothetical protein [Chitinophagaceae bacterium]